MNGIQNISIYIVHDQEYLLTPGLEMFSKRNTILQLFGGLWNYISNI